MTILATSTAPVLRGKPPKRGRGPGRRWTYPQFPKMPVNSYFTIWLDQTTIDAAWQRVARANQRLKPKKFVTRRRDAAKVEVWRVR